MNHPAISGSQRPVTAPRVTSVPPAAAQSSDNHAPVAAGSDVSAVVEDSTYFEAEENPHEELFRAATSHDFKARLDSIPRLQALGGKEAVAALIHLTKDEHYFIRLPAVEALFTRPESEALDAIRHTCRVDEDPTIRKSAATFLLRCGEAAGDFASSLTPEEAFQQARGLPPGESVMLIPLVERALDSQDRSTRAEAIRLLKRVGIEALPALARGAVDMENVVRASTARALYGRGAEIAPLLRQLKAVRTYTGDRDRVARAEKQMNKIIKQQEKDAARAALAQAGTPARKRFLLF